MDFLLIKTVISRERSDRGNLLLEGCMAVRGDSHVGLRPPRNDLLYLTAMRAGDCKGGAFRAREREISAPQRQLLSSLSCQDKKGSRGRLIYETATATATFVLKNA